MDALLNIGLTRNTEGYVRVSDIMSQFAIHHVQTHGGRVAFNPNGEDAFIAHVTNVDADKLYSMSLALEQDCIAVYDLHACSGALIGPNAAAWGEFSPNYFQVL